MSLIMSLSCASSRGGHGTALSRYLATTDRRRLPLLLLPLLVLLLWLAIQRQPVYAARLAGRQ